jgi:hypothetical protein
MKDQFAYITIYDHVEFFKHTLDKHNFNYSETKMDRERYGIYIKISEKDLSRLMHLLQEDGNMTDHLRTQLQKAGNERFEWK